MPMMKRWRLCCEIDNVFEDIPACFVHVLSKFSGFSLDLPQVDLTIIPGENVLASES